MADPHLFFNDQTQYGRQLRRVLQMMEESDDLLRDVRATMIQMRDGDGSQDAHYVEVTARFGFLSDTEARAAFNELDSAYIKTAGDDPTDHVRTARDNLFDKLR